MGMMEKQRFVFFISLFVLFQGTCVSLWAADEPVNISALGVAAQSTDLNASYGAGNAIDGNLGNFTHTTSADPAPYWQLVFEEETEFSTVILHNRDSCCGSRLRDIMVFILDEPDGNIVYESDILNPENELGAFPLGPEFIEVDIVADMGESVSGRVIRVERIPDDDLSGTGGQGNNDEARVLSLGEVLVYGAFEGIIQQPVGGRVYYGQTFEFIVAASVATGELTYQWKKDGEDIEGATDPTYTIDFIELDDAGEYSVVVEGDGRLFESIPALLEVPGLNMALYGVATQSSDYNTNYTADRAIDGNFTNVTHTQSSQIDPWWEVDLIQSVEIEKIIIYNRTDCCGSRLRDIVVTVLEDIDDVVYETDLLNEENELGVFPDGPQTLEIDIVAELGESVTGRIVRVSRLSDPDLSGTGGQGDVNEADVLSIAEVEIFTSMIECPAEGDTHMADLFAEGPGDNQPGIYTITAVAEDDSDDTVLLYTFEISNSLNEGQSRVIGPQADNVITETLSIGSWTVTATVDDNRFCRDEADDASRTLGFVVEGDTDNLAWQGIPTQTSTCYTDPAYYAVDGDPATFSHTCASDDEAAWEVDFGAVCTIDFIELQNRAGYESRLRDITILILDGDRNELFVSELLNPENELLNPPTLSIDFAEEMGESAVGQIVRIERAPDPDGSGSAGQGDANDDKTVLSLVEVVILGEFGGSIGGVPVFTGDANCDGSVNLADAVGVLVYYFGGGQACCLANMDANGDGGVNIADAVALLSYQFSGGRLIGPDGVVITDPGCHEYSEDDIPAELRVCDQPCPYNR